MSTTRQDAIETALGYRFADPDLLTRALTHRSHGDGRRRGADNQRLEFLGDRVLGLLAAEALFTRFSDTSEGGLAPRLNALVRKETCADVARAMGLGEALFLSPAEVQRGGRDKDSILGDACEAVMAALYLDAGLEVARGVFERYWDAALSDLTSRPQDPKSALQERAAARKLPAPAYDVVDRSGPAHRPVFRVTVSVEGWGAAEGEGGSKQSAERAAAEALLNTSYEGADDRI